MEAPGMRRIAIIGIGGHGREQLDLIAAINLVGRRYTVEGFVVDCEYAVAGDQMRGLPVHSGLDWIEARRENVVAVCAIGDSARRARVVGRLQQAGVRFETLIHPAAIVSESATISEGAIVCAGSILTTDVRVGAHVHIGVGSIVSHDCVLGEFASLAPGCRLAGTVHIGSGALLGIGTTIRDRVSVGAWSITGAGTVVIDDIPADSTVVGIPARVVATRQPGWQQGEAHTTPESVP